MELNWTFHNTLELGKIIKFEQMPNILVSIISHVLASSFVLCPAAIIV